METLEEDIEFEENPEDEFDMLQGVNTWKDLQ